MSIDQQVCVNCGWIGTIEQKERREDDLYSSTYVCPICKSERFYLLDDLENKVDAAEDWNTRQPAFDWKPIEELSLNLLKEGKKIVLYNKKRPFTDEYDFIDENAYEEYGEDLHQLLEDVKTTCSHYSLLTPPQTNQ